MRKKRHSIRERRNSTEKIPTAKRSQLTKFRKNIIKKPKPKKPHGCFNLIDDHLGSFADFISSAACVYFSRVVRSDKRFFPRIKISTYTHRYLTKFMVLFLFFRRKTQFAHVAYQYLVKRHTRRAFRASCSSARLLFRWLMAINHQPAISGP